MTTREIIIDTADGLIRAKGYNAFSFKDISNDIGIKTASIHYHFPTKSDLCVATIHEHVSRFEALKASVAGKSSVAKLQGFISTYSKMSAENKVCLVGSLATDLNTVDEKIKKELQNFAALILNWITSVLEEGKKKKEIEFTLPARSKALMVITNLLAIVQLSRLTGKKDFEIVRDNILKELKPKK